jgi:hypothetical protein
MIQDRQNIDLSIAAVSGGKTSYERGEQRSRYAS